MTTAAEASTMSGGSLESSEMTDRHLLPSGSEGMKQQEQETEHDTSTSGADDESMNHSRSEEKLAGMAEQSTSTAALPDDASMDGNIVDTSLNQHHSSISLIITHRNKPKKSAPKITDLKKQREKIQSIENKSPFKPGATFVLISSKWWTDWKHYVKYSEEESAEKKKKTRNSEETPNGVCHSPGPIDNRDIIDKTIIYRCFKLSHPFVDEFTHFNWNGSVLFSTLLKKHVNMGVDMEIISEEVCMI